MPIRNIVRGQKIETGKAMLARELRREMTPTEQLLWQHLRGNRLGGLHFRRQQVVDGFIADFYCHSASVIVEVDGGVHLKQSQYDEGRDKILSLRGFRIFRIRNEDVHGDLKSVLKQIADFCLEET